MVGASCFGRERVYLDRTEIERQVANFKINE